MITREKINNEFLNKNDITDEIITIFLESQNVIFFDYLNIFPIVINEKEGICKK